MQLVQVLYNPRIPLPTGFSFYKQSLDDIKFFGISSQVYFLLLQKGKLDQTPPFFQERLKQQYDEALYQNIFIKNQTEQLLNYFEIQEIDIIPLKGVVFAEKYFGHIGARSTSDIDVLIKTSDLEKAIECVKCLGYRIEQKRITSHFHCSFSKELPNSPIPLTVELHWDILKENTANFNINELWDQATSIKQSKHIKELTDYHTFYMICLHGWRHNLDSLKYFIDIIQMIYTLNDKLDFTTLFKDAAFHKTLKRIIRTLSIVYQQFPQLESIKEFPRKRSSLLWDYNAIRNINGKRTVKHYIDFIDYQIFSYDTAKHSVVELLHLILEITEKKRNFFRCK